MTTYWRWIRAVSDVIRVAEHDVSPDTDWHALWQDALTPEKAVEVAVAAGKEHEDG